MSVKQTAFAIDDRDVCNASGQTNTQGKAASHEFRNATRIQSSITARPERKVLLWLAERMPPYINSDHLTLIGFVAMFLACGGYILARWNRAGLLLATLFLVLNWFGDSLDGTLARVRNRQRPHYGFYVDHMVDSLGAVLLMGGLAVSGYIDWRIAVGMLVAFLLLSIETYLASYTLGIFRLSFGMFGPTEIRILLAIGNITLWFRPNLRIPVSTYRVLDFGGVVAICGMMIILGITALWHTARLYREETRP